MTNQKQYLNPSPQPYHRIKVDKIEQRHHAKYMGAWEYSDFECPLDIFFITKPVVLDGYLARKYVGLFIDGPEIVAIPADDVFDGIIVGVEAEDGEICISRHPAEHYVSKDLSTWVQGGVGHIRTNRLDHQVRVYVTDDRFEYEPLGCLEVDTQRSFFSILTWQ